MKITLALAGVAATAFVFGVVSAGPALADSHNPFWSGHMSTSGHHQTGAYTYNHAKYWQEHQYVATKHHKHHHHSTKSWQNHDQSWHNGKGDAWQAQHSRIDRGLGNGSDKGHDNDYGHDNGRGNNGHDNGNHGHNH